MPSAAHITIIDSSSSSGSVAGGSSSSVNYGTLEHPWSENSPFNIPLPSNVAVDANSSHIISSVIGNSSLVVNLEGPYGFGVPIYTATPSTPRVNLSRKAYTRTTPIDPSWTPNPSSDAKIAVIDPVEGVMYDIDGFAQPNTSVWAVYHPYATSIVDGLQSYAEGRGTTGSAMTVLAGLITLSDLASGSIEHALCGMTSAPSTNFRYPAGQTDGQSTAAYTIDEGMRLQLDPSINVDAISGATVFEKMVMKALQKYGWYCNDTGGGSDQSMSFYVEKPKTSFGQTDPYPSYGVTQDFQVLSHIPKTSLRVIAESVTYAGMTRG